MSLTLRDAQYLSWKTIHKFGSAKEQILLDSTATILKKAQAIADELKNSGSSNKDSLGLLFSELLFSLFIIAEQQGLNLEESFLSAIDEIILNLVS
ncbi:MAG: hypothetical protein GX638_06150 [Crenarchaeota archaeon]|nr:hypothetical protein [Thermoproteota archaeon]